MNQRVTRNQPVCTDYFAIGTGNLSGVSEQPPLVAQNLTDFLLKGVNCCRLRMLAERNHLRRLDIYSSSLCLILFIGKSAMILISLLRWMQLLRFNWELGKAKL